MLHSRGKTRKDHDGTRIARDDSHRLPRFRCERKKKHHKGGNEKSNETVHGAVGVSKHEHTNLPEDSAAQWTRYKESIRTLGGREKKKAEAIDRDGLGKMVNDD